METQERLSKKRKHAFTSSKLFRRTLLTYLLLFTIPLATLGGILIQEKSRTDKKEAEDALNRQIERITQDLDDEFYRINMLGNSMIGSFWLTQAFTGNRTVVSYNMFDRNSTVQTMQVYSTMCRFSSDFCIFLPRKEEIINTVGWWEADSYFLYRKEDNPNQWEELLQIIDNDSSFHLLRHEDGSLSAMQSLDILSNPRAFLYVPLDQKAIDSMLATYAPDGLLSLELLVNDTTLYHYGTAEHPSTSFQKTEKSALYPWSYRFVFAERSAEPWLLQLSKIVGMLLLTLLLAYLISYFTARFSYRPLSRLFLRMNAAGLAEHEQDFAAIEATFDTLMLEREKAESLQQVYYDVGRNQLLGSLLRGFFSEEDKLPELLQTFNLPFTDDLYYSVIVFCDLEGAAIPKITQDIRMKLSFIVMDYCQHAPVALSYVEMLDDTIILIYSSETSITEGKAAEQADFLEEYIKAGTGLVPALVCGTCEQGILGISKSYQNVKMDAFLPSAGKQRDIAGQSERYYYPTDWEIQLIQYLQTGNESMARKILGELQSENSRRALSPEAEHQVTSMIFETALRVMEEQKLDVSLARVERDHLSPENTSTARWDAVGQVAENMCHQIQKQLTCEGQTVGVQMMLYVDQHYNRSSLSLNELAEVFSLSPSAASRAFKVTAKTTFIDYLMSLRMEEAKRLLEEGCCCTIAEVSGQVGYDNDTSFKRAFVRYEGVTPKQYSESLRK